MIASVVLAVAVVGVAGMLTASYQQSRDLVATSEATALARQLMEEISGKPFAVAAAETDNPGYSVTNTNRATFDDVDDYDGYTDVSTSLKTLSGATQSIGTAGPYTRSVTVTNGVVPTGHTATAANFKLVKVTVTRPSGSPVVISKVFTNTTVTQ